jgi:hypothetical protein
MCKKTLLTLTMLVVASLAAFAANKDGVVLSKDGRMTVATKVGHAAVKTPIPDWGKVSIFDNIGTAYPKGTYWCCEGYTITGPTALTSFPEFWEAAAFTPSADHTVTVVQVAVGFVEGTNGLVLSINDDASGVPGTAIKTWSLSGLPNFGSCCVVQMKKDSGIAVKAGTQYWIVLKTNSKESNTWAAWNVNDTDQVDPAPTAFYCSDDKGGSCGNNDKWTAGQAVPGPAFAVRGSN